MTLGILILQIILTIPLSLILKYTEEKINQPTRLLLPTVYTIIISAIIPYVKPNIYLIVVFEIFVRNFYITNISKRHTVKNNIMFIIESIISIGLSLFTYNYFISQVNSVVPNPDDIKGFIWFLVIIFIFVIYNKLTVDKKEIIKKKTIEHNTENIVVDYAKLKNKYSLYVNSKYKIVNDLAYAIMIYNSKTKPEINRKFAEYKGIITRKETAFGIMQIKSYHHLTDEESILEAIKKLDEKYTNTDKKLESILSDYNETEQKDIIKIYADIVEFTKK